MADEGKAVKRQGVVPVNKPVDARRRARAVANVIPGKLWLRFRVAMFEAAIDKVAGDSNVKRTLRLARENVDEICGFFTGKFAGHHTPSS